MRILIYYLALPFLYLISWLPFALLYVLSDLLYLLIFKLFRYRKNVVLENLNNAFPDKSATEITDISKRFYRHFCDTSLETIKLLSISQASLLKRISCDDLSLLEQYKQDRQSVILVLGHLGNWEMAGAFMSTQNIPKLYAIYHPLANRKFDQLMIKMRTRFGAGVYPMKGALRGMLKNKHEVTSTAFIADQTAGRKNAHWMSFLNQPTAVFKGTEMIANKLGYPVIYISVKNLHRGHYRLSCELLTDQPQKLAENQLTEMHSRRLEQDIIRQPEAWLWTHRRWKKRPNKPNQSSRTEPTDTKIS